MLDRCVRSGSNFANNYRGSRLLNCLLGWGGGGRVFYAAGIVTKG